MHPAPSHEYVEQPKSNIKQHGDGHRIYDKFVKPAMVDLIKVTAHFAISSIFEQYNGQAEIYCYHVDIENHQTSDCGKAKLAAGRAKITSSITRESDTLSFGVLHLGDHNVNAGVREYQGEEAYQTMVAETTQTCATADFPEVIRLLDKHFGTSTYSIKNLFLDEQRKVLDSIMESTLSEIEAAYRQVYEHNYPPMRFLSELGNPIPKSFHSAAEFILNSALRKAVSSETLNSVRIKSLLDEVQTWKLELDVEGLSYLLQHTLEQMTARLVNTPEDINLLNELHTAMEIVHSVPFSVDLWKVQNLYHDMRRSVYPEIQKRAEQKGKAAQEWLSEFNTLGQQLSLRVG